MFSIHYWLALAAVVLTAIAHLALKLGATTASGAHRLAIWLNARTIAGYALMLLVTLMNLYAFKVVPIRANVVLSPLVLFCVTGLAVLVLGEKLTRRQMAGSFLIIVGIAVFSV